MNSSSFIPYHLDVLVFEWTIRIASSFSQGELIHVCTGSGQNEQEIKPTRAPALEGTN